MVEADREQAGEQPPERRADAVKQELQVHDPGERVPLFVFAA